MVQLALILTAICAILFGLFVFVNNPKSLVFQVFFIFSISSSLWILVNALVVGYPIQLSGGALLAVSRFITPFSLVTLLIFNYFLSVFLKISISNLDRIVAVLTFAVCMFSFSSANVYFDDNQELTLGALYPFYSVLLVLGVFIVIKKLYAKQSTAIVKLPQIRLMRIGAITAIIPAAFVGSILPLFTTSDITNLGPLFAIFFIGAVGLAVVQHGLFDVRLVVARSVGYLLAISSVSFFYGFIAFSTINRIFQGAVSDGSAIQQAVYTLLAVGMAFTFQPLKKFFDRWTNKLFYRDAYEPQELLDRLNQVLVSTIDLNNLLKLSTEVIEQNLKAEFCVFGLKETDFAEQRIIGNTQRKFDYQDISYARAITPQMDHKVIVADHLDEPDKELRGKMRRNEVAVLARLTSDVDQEGIGYIVLGAKKSGNPYNSQDIRVLETIANAMVIAIDNALRFEEIQKFNITLEKRVEDATRRLQRANDKLIALDQTKDDFISMASHQLRTPLTSVKGYLSMVLEGDAGKINPQQTKLLDQAFISSQRMVYLIADLLNVSRLRTGKFVIEASSVNLADVVEGEVNQLVETAAARNLNLTYTKPKNFPDLMLDETKIRQVVMNFIDNAIYYTPAGGEITVRLKQVGDSIEYTVQDTGIGVPRSEQHNLFSKFFRAGNARKARPDGTGLGLFMAKKVVVAQGGAVIFKSAEGKGSTFGFTFEKAKLAPRDKAESPKVKSS